MGKLNIEGVFSAVCATPANGWFGEAGENQTPYIRIPLVTADGEEIEWTGWLSDKAFEGTIRTLVKAFGWDGDLTGLDTMKVDPFSGKEVEIETEYDTYNGKTRLKVKWLNPVGGGGRPKPLDPNKLSNLVRALGRQSQAVAKAVIAENGGAPVQRQQQPTRTQQRQQNPAADLDGDDVPF